MMKDATVEKEARESQKRTLTILFASLILDLLGFTVILPLMPSLLEYYHQHDKVHNKGAWVNITRLNVAAISKYL